MQKRILKNNLSLLGLLKVLDSLLTWSLLHLVFLFFFLFLLFVCSSEIAQHSTQLSTASSSFSFEPRWTQEHSPGRKTIIELYHAGKEPHKRECFNPNGCTRFIKITFTLNQNLYAKCLWNTAFLYQLILQNKNHTKTIFCENLKCTIINICCKPQRFLLIHLHLYPFLHGYTFRRCRPHLSPPETPSHCPPYWNSSHSRCRYCGVTVLLTDTPVRSKLKQQPVIIWG